MLSVFSSSIICIVSTSIAVIMPITISVATTTTVAATTSFHLSCEARIRRLGCRGTGGVVFRQRTWGDGKTSLLVQYLRGTKGYPLGSYKDYSTPKRLKVTYSTTMLLLSMRSSWHRDTRWGSRLDQQKLRSIRVFILKAPFRCRRTAPKAQSGEQLTVFGKLGTIREHCATPHSEITQQLTGHPRRSLPDLIPFSAAFLPTVQQADFLEPPPPPLILWPLLSHGLLLHLPVPDPQPYISIRV